MLVTRRYRDKYSSFALSDIAHRLRVERNLSNMMHCGSSELTV